VIKGLPAEVYFIQYNPDCDLDKVDRLVKTSSEASTLKIRIPMSVDKRKRCTEESLLSEAKDSDAPSKQMKSKSRSLTPTRQSGKMTTHFRTSSPNRRRSSEDVQKLPRPVLAEIFLIPVYL
jgi:hypothetical protein